MIVADCRIHKNTKENNVSLFRCVSIKFNKLCLVTFSRYSQYLHSDKCKALGLLCIFIKTFLRVKINFVPGEVVIPVISVIS